FDYFDWAGIAPNSFAQPRLWKLIQLMGAPAGGTPPSVAITSPASGAIVSAAVTVSGTAADDVGVSRVEVSVDGGSPQVATGTTTWSLTLNTLALANGLHTIVARAVDTAGTSSTVSVTVTVSNDTTPPS